MTKVTEIPSICAQLFYHANCKKGSLYTFINNILSNNVFVGKIRTLKVY